ncbi:hypothetical protein, partial [Burkholderia sp. Ac-20384]|uniref:hypothetical protein n=1 Tax=Burkholderia sp. Ac-20384 TaxID=2703902 RepID=UPI001981AC1C
RSVSGCNKPGYKAATHPVVVRAHENPSQTGGVHIKGYVTLHFETSCVATDDHARLAADVQANGGRSIYERRFPRPTNASIVEVT